MRMFAAVNVMMFVNPALAYLYRPVPCIVDSGGVRFDRIGWTNNLNHKPMTEYFQPFHKHGNEHVPIMKELVVEAPIFHFHSRD